MPAACSLRFIPPLIGSLFLSEASGKLLPIALTKYSTCGDVIAVMLMDQTVIVRAGRGGDRWMRLKKGQPDDAPPARKLN